MLTALCNTVLRNCAKLQKPTRWIWPLNYFSNTESDNSTAAQRVLVQGLQYSSMAENITAGQTTIANIVGSWMNSAGHRANILGNYKLFGARYTYNSSSSYGHYWTQTFGTASSRSVHNPKGRSDFRSDLPINSFKYPSTDHTSID
uniref:SCP domain-containing protein n=1 Tax=Globisporangium ultimum (strain ATCC 200006 / CBS 805.95 / DAOM BR144) TaxID=431595 RepID=K3WI13_GLOUD